MYWKELENLDEAPLRGQMLVYTREKLIFKSYETMDEVANNLKREELLEVHLFDDEKEYRAISTRSRRFPNGIIQTIAAFPVDDVNVYKENILLAGERQGTIMVLNHISYNEDGMASVDNYRLRMGEN